MDQLIKALAFLPFDFTPRRLQVLGLLVMIVVLLLASWYRGPGDGSADLGLRPTPPVVDDALRGRLAPAIPRDAAAESAAFGVAFSGVADAVERSMAETAAAKRPADRGEYRTVEQVLRAVRLANEGVLKEGRVQAWRPFFAALEVEIRSLYDGGGLRELPQAVKLLRAVASTLSES